MLNKRKLYYLIAVIDGALIGVNIAESITAREQAKLVFGSGAEKASLASDAETFKKILLNRESYTLDETVKFLNSVAANKEAIIQNDEARIEYIFKGTPLKRKLISTATSVAVTMLLTKVAISR